MSRNTDAPQPSVAEVLGPYLVQQCVTALSISEALQTELDASADEIDPEQVHDLRVAYRRIRSVVRVFADFFSVPEAARISDDAGWLAIRLGAVRDLDVLSDRIADSISRLEDDLVLHDPLGELRSQVSTRRQVACAELRDGLHSEIHADLSEQLRSWQQHQPWAPPADKSANKIKKYVKSADQRLTKRLSRAAAAIRTGDPDTDELIHAARKAAKRHRYAIEAARPVLGSSADKITQSRKDLQDRLGDYQDSVLTSGFLRDLGGIPGRNGFTFGLLYAREEAHRERARKQLAKRVG